MAEVYLTSRDLEMKYKVGRATIDKWKKEGMPYIKKERVVRFEEEKVDKWLRDNPDES